MYNNMSKKKTRKSSCDLNLRIYGSMINVILCPRLPLLSHVQLYVERSAREPADEVRTFLHVDTDLLVVGLEI